MITGSDVTYGVHSRYIHRYMYTVLYCLVVIPSSGFIHLRLDLTSTSDVVQFANASGTAIIVRAIIIHRPS